MAYGRRAVLEGLCSPTCTSLRARGSAIPQRQTGLLHHRHRAVIDDTAFSINDLQTLLSQQADLKDKREIFQLTEGGTCGETVKAAPPAR